MLDSTVGKWPTMMIAAAVGLLGAPAIAPGGTGVYATTFTDGADSKWSSEDIIRLSVKENAALGRFTNDTITLKLADLPPHALVRIEFDLILLRTWDGNKPKIGPDTWVMKTDDDRIWVNHTFANGINGQTNGVMQSYPGTLPGERVPARTGAAATNSVRGYDMSSTYAMRFDFPHRKDSITFSFAGVGLQDVDNESWALDNVRVAVLNQDEMPVASAQQLASMIRDLQTADPVKAWSAMLAAVAQGDRFVERAGAVWKQTNADEMIQALEKRVAAWIVQLDDDSFDVREKASKQLILHRAVAQSIISDALKQDDLTPEQRWRLKQVIESAGNAPAVATSQRFTLRLIRTLNLIGTDSANALAKQIGGMASPLPELTPSP